MIAKQASSLVSLFNENVLKKTLRVTSCINCITDESDTFLYKLIENSTFNKKEVVIFKNEESEKDLKSLTIVDNGVKYLFGENIFSEDIFKSKHNQKVLKMASLMNENDFKNLDFMIIDVTSIFENFVSKILKISDNILILANTTQESLKKVISKFNSMNLKDTEKFDIIFINKNNYGNFDLRKHLIDFKEIIEKNFNVNLKVSSLVLNGFSNIEMYKIGEKIYIDSLSNMTSKNMNFFDFVINILN